MIKTQGLLPLKEDARDYKFGSIHKPINLNELAGKDFDVWVPDEILDQTLDSRTQDYCGGFGMAQILKAHENKKLSPQYIFAKGKQLAGDPESFGLDLRTIFKVPVKFGALEEKDVPQDYLGIRDGSNWPFYLDELAAPQKQQSFFFIEQDGYPDLFDSLRAALWQYKDKKNLVGTGVAWEENWNYAKGRIDSSGSQPEYGHFIVISGVKYFDGQPYLKVINSAGTGHGDQGYDYLSREVVNKKFTYGAGMLIDLPPNKAKFMADRNIKIGDNWLVFIWKSVFNFFK